MEASVLAALNPNTRPPVQRSLSSAWRAGEAGALGPGSGSAQAYLFLFLFLLRNPWLVMQAMPLEFKKAKEGRRLRGARSPSTSPAPSLTLRPPPTQAACQRRWPPLCRAPCLEARTPARAPPRAAPPTRPTTRPTTRFREGEASAERSARLYICIYASVVCVYINVSARL